MDAAQWFKPGDHPAVLAASDPALTGYIDTPEGRLTVEPGDWIITGIAGENYPCKPDILNSSTHPSTKARSVKSRSCGARHLPRPCDLRFILQTAKIELLI